MKKITILLLLICCGLTSLSQRVMGKYELGKMSYSELMRISNVDDVNVYETFIDDDLVRRATADNYQYKGSLCRVVFVTVNDTLRLIEYYPNDRGYYRYVSFLNRRYSVTVSFGDRNSSILWHNEYVVITKNMTGNYEEYFTHYDKKYINRNPKYKLY